jgi:dTMP kinase
MRVHPDLFRLQKIPAFVVLEGINGCGKTTLHRNLSARLLASGLKLANTREPGGTPLGMELRKLTLEWNQEKKSDIAELLLFAADRAEHVEKVINPALSSGITVLCDRYLYSTISFQGYGRGIDRNLIDAANSLATSRARQPDLVVLLDLDPKVALARIAARTGNGRDGFEDEDFDFHERIRDGFLDCADSSEVPFLVIDANGSPEELLAETLKVFSQVIPS